MNSLKKFCLDYKVVKVAVAIAIVVEIIIFFIFDRLPIWIFLGLLMDWCIVFEFSGRYKGDFKRRINELENTGKINIVLSDFEKYHEVQQRQAINGNMIVGDYCIIGASYGMVFCYDEIQLLSIETRNIASRGKPAHYSDYVFVRCNNRHYKFCYVSDRNQYLNEFYSICNFIHTKNPYTQFEIGQTRS